MTVPSTPRRAGPFNGNGTATSFPFTFKVQSTADVEVTKTSTAGVDHVLVLDYDYSVTINPDQDATPGGTITYPITDSFSPLAFGEKLSVIGSTEYSQELDLTSGGNFNPQTIEDALDRNVFQIQQLAEKVDRSLKLAASTPPGFDAQLPAPAPYGMIGFNADCTGFVVTDPTGTTALAGDLAQPTGAAMVGADDGVGGSRFTTVAGFITRLASSAGAAIIGFTQGVTGAVARTLQDKLRETVSFKDFGGVCDGVTDDSAAMGVLFAYLNAKTTPVRVVFNGQILLGAGWASGTVLPPGHVYDFAGSTLLIGKSVGEVFSLRNDAGRAAATVVNDITVDGQNYAMNVFGVGPAHTRTEFNNPTFRNIRRTVSAAVSPYKQIQQDQGGCCFAIELAGTVVIDNPRATDVFCMFRIGSYAGYLGSTTSVLITNVYAKRVEAITSTTQSNFDQDEHSYLASWAYDTSNVVKIDGVVFEDCGFSSDRSVGVSFQWQNTSTYGPTPSGNVYPWAAIGTDAPATSYTYQPWLPIPYNAALAEWSAGGSYVAGNQVKVTNDNTLGAVFCFGGGSGISISGVRGRNIYNTNNPDIGNKRIGALFRGCMRNVQISDVNVDAPCVSMIWFGTSPTTWFDAKPYDTSRNVHIKDVYNLGECKYLAYSDMPVAGSWYNAQPGGTNPIVVDYALGVSQCILDNVKARFINTALVHTSLSTTAPAGTTNLDPSTWVRLFTPAGYERIGRFSDFASGGYCNDTTTAYPKYGAAFLKNPSFGLLASSTPQANGEMVFQLTSNTQATLKVKGTDGVVRSANITLS